MKLFLTILVFVTAFLPAAFAEQSGTRKPPLGLPSDATFFKGRWYRVFLEKSDWERARRRCAELRGQLAVVPDEPTWAFLKPLTRGVTIWLGASDEQLEGTWRWIDGTPLTFSAWRPARPDNHRGNEDHLLITEGGWDDGEKNGKIDGFVCQWEDR